MIRILLVALLLPGLPAHALESAPAKPFAPLAKPTTGMAASEAAATHHWYDGDRRRALVVDENLQADFRGGKAVLAERKAPEAKALDAPASVAAPGTSPVFRDAAAPAVKRALPGGAILTTHEPTDQQSLQRMLSPHGVSVMRALDEGGTRWLVDTPAGLAGLELANRLHESGDFAAAAPNWWRERVLK
ncbi:MAG: hypothetical protein WCZ28_16875 [Burkholderiaceae bacterium]